MSCFTLTLARVFRQVQRIKNTFTVEVYEGHARIALQKVCYAPHFSCGSKSPDRDMSCLARVLLTRSRFPFRSVYRFRWALCTHVLERSCSSYSCWAGWRIVQQISIQFRTNGTNSLHGTCGLPCGRGTLTSTTNARRNCKNYTPVDYLDSTTSLRHTGCCTISTCKLAAREDPQAFSKFSRSCRLGNSTPRSATRCVFDKPYH